MRYNSLVKLALLFVALPLFGQIHVEACSAADQGFSLPSTCYTSPIASPSGVPAYFQKERYGTFNYHFAVADGSYAVTLHFIENSTAITGPGQRVFAVGIGSAIVIPSLDLFATAGLNVPVDRSFTAAAAGGTGIIIGFVTIVRNAVVSAIDITPLPVAPFPGCNPDGTQGIQCAGGFSVAPGQHISGALILADPTNVGGAGWSVAANAGPLILLLMPVGDGTAKFLRDRGAVPCPPLHVTVVALNPTCHQAEWATPGQ